MDILQTILDSKMREVERRRSALPIEELQRRCGELNPSDLRPFRRSLIARAHDSIGVIAEFKRRSPSKGQIRSQADPVSISRAYEAAGAAAISVLTDEEFFGGSLDDMAAVKSAVRLPVLRKDFVVDAYQVWESRLWGADAILLIRAALPAKKMIELHRLAAKLGMEALWEFHSPEECQDIECASDALIGINNRNLKTFEVDLGQTERTIRRLPEGAFVISESGISTAADLSRLRRIGARGILVGETLMRAEDPGQALRVLLSGETK